MLPFRLFAYLFLIFDFVFSILLCWNLLKTSWERDVEGNYFYFFKRGWGIRWTYLFFASKAFTYVVDEIFSFVSFYCVLFLFLKIDFMSLSPLGALSFTCVIIYFELGSFENKQYFLMWRIPLHSVFNTSSIRIWLLKDNLLVWCFFKLVYPVVLGYKCKHTSLFVWLRCLFQFLTSS